VHSPHGARQGHSTIQGILRAGEGQPAPYQGMVTGPGLLVTIGTWPTIPDTPQDTGADSTNSVNTTAATNSVNTTAATDSFNTTAATNSLNTTAATDSLNTTAATEPLQYCCYR